MGRFLLLLVAVLGWPATGWIAGILALMWVTRRGAVHLTTLGSARWASVRDMRKAGMLDGNSGGPRFIGLLGGLSVLPMMAIMAAKRDCNPGPLTALMVLFIARWFAGRAAHLYRLVRRRPLPCHSRYAGTPLLTKVFPTLSEKTAQWLECPIVFVVGAGLNLLNQPLGLYLMLASVAMGVWLMLGQMYTTNRTMDMRDNAIEQQAMAEKFKESNAN